MNVDDRLALAGLVHRYAAAIDDRRFDDAAELFTDTAELKLPDPPQFLEPTRDHNGHDMIRPALATVAAVARTEHAIVGEIYWDGGESNFACGRITCIAHHWTKHGDGFTDLIWHLRYDDEYVRTEAGWRIRLRALTINAIETRPVRRVR